MAKDFYTQPDAPDPVLGSRLALEIAQRHAPSAAAVTAVDENGGEARAYAIDGDLILKVQRPQQSRPRTSLRKERFFLSRLADTPGVRVPRVLGGGMAGPEIEYTLMTRMPGVAIEFSELAGEARRQSLSDLGRMLRRIHGIPQAPLFESRLIPGDHTPVDVRWRLGGLFGDALAYIGGLPEVWTFDIGPERVARLAMRVLPEVDAWVALHSNPGPEHVFIDPASKTLTGIIDFGDAYFSHPVHDLRRFRCPADRAAIHAGYIAEAPQTDNFEQTWRVACVLADMLAIALNPDCRAAAHAELSALMPQLA